MLGIRWREFISLLGARAQQPERMRRVGVFTNLASDDPEAQARIGAFTQGLHVRCDYLGRPLIIPVIANILRSWWLSVRLSFYALPAQLDAVVLIRPTQAIATRTPDER